MRPALTIIPGLAPRQSARSASRIGWLMLLLWPGLMGCAQRTITITSEPAGALVHLNDQELGQTPVTVPFTFYGTYDVRLQAARHQPLWTTRKAAAPLWEYPGPDLVFEAIPGARVNLDWHFELEPQTQASPDEVQARADAMRQRVQREATRSVADADADAKPKAEAESDPAEPSDAPAGAVP